MFVIYKTINVFHKNIMFKLIYVIVSSKINEHMKDFALINYNVIIPIII